MSLSRLSKQCIECPYKASCTHKQIETLAEIPPKNMADSISPNINPITFPNLRETITVNMYGEKLTMYKDILEKMIDKNFDVLGENVYGKK